MNKKETKTSCTNKPTTTMNEFRLGADDKKKKKKKKKKKILPC